MMTGVVGAVCGLVGLFLPFLILKPNRIAEGTLFVLWRLPESGRLVILGIVAMVVALLLLSIMAMRSDKRGDPNGGTRSVARGMIGCGLALYSLMVICLGHSGQMLITAEIAFGRIGPSIGFWLLLLAAWLSINTSLRRFSLPAGIAFVVRCAPLLLTVTLLWSGYLDSVSVVQEFYNRQDRFISDLIGHLLLSVVAVSCAILIGVPLGILAWSAPKVERAIFGVVNGIQTIPSLALFGLLIAPLAFLSQRFPVLRAVGIRGIGSTPALIALTLYALLPIIRNAYAGIANISASVVDAGRGVGMNRPQLLRYIEFPISLPIILGGIRTSAVQTVGNATIAALIGARSLGNFVFQGLGQAAPDLIMLGVVPIVVLAIGIDRLLGWMLVHITPAGLRMESP